VWLGRLLAASLVLYAIQSVYSPDFQAALQNMVFFYVPFALLYVLLREVRWTPELLRICLLVAVGLGIVFSAVGFAEYATKTIFLNQKLITTNDLHAYFTVNSLFFDPDIFGRYLALTMLLLAAGLLYRRAGRDLWMTIAALAVMWACLILTLSRSSLAALLVGMAVLAALRWRPSRALVAAVVVIVLGAIVVVATPHTFGLEQGANGVSSGRGGLVSGGISLFADRPVWGWGSGSFVTEYRHHHQNVNTSLSASHTIPVTVAAEQGVIGLIVYAALVLCALAVLMRGARGDPVRSAIAATFVALLFHTLLYADFLEDPTTWALLGVGAALAATARGTAGVAGHQTVLTGPLDAPHRHSGVV
jgi:O-antigen ligase